MKIDTIIVDVGGVLIRGYDIMSDVQARVGLPDAVFLPIWRQLVDEYGSGKIDKATMWATFAEAGGDTVAIEENLFGTPFEKHLVVYEHVLTRLRSLGEKGYRLAILSNTNPNHEEVLIRRGVYTPFGENVFLSHRIGHRKPTPGAYRHALTLLHIEDPSSALFIDDLSTNTESAAALGLKATQVNGTEEDVISVLENL